MLQSYGYDSFNRITSATETARGSTTWSESFGYCNYGNLIVPSSTGVPVSPLTPTACSNYNLNNQLVASGNYGYDPAGNQTFMSPYTVSYDGENRQTGITSSLNGSAAYTYDGEGRRVTKTVGGATTVYVYDAAGEMAGEYSMGPQNAPCQTCYLTVDPLGSIRAVTDPSGQLVSQHDYLPFGEELATANRAGFPYGVADGVSRRFTGKVRDGETGLDYFGARYYLGVEGRFTSADPVFVTAHRVNDPQQWNLYAYSRDNPLRFTDPTGLDIWLRGCGDESDACHKGYVGSYDDNGNFNRAHPSGDLTDSASLGTTGISVGFNGGTFQGVWDTNKNEQGAVAVGGSGALSDLSFTVNGNCNGTCQASGFVNGTNTASGLQALQFAVTSHGSGFLKNPGTYIFDPFHPGRTNFMGYDPDQPQGLPSTHLPVPSSLIFGPNGQPTNVDFHIDQRYPFEDLTGVVNHVGSVGHTLVNDVRSIFSGLVDQGSH